MYEFLKKKKKEEESSFEKSFSMTVHTLNIHESFYHLRILSHLSVLAPYIEMSLALNRFPWICLISRNSFK